MSAPAPERVEKQRIERDAILKAAFGLIGRGHDGPVSVQQILDAAGLSTRAFYRHFHSKDELIITMCRTAAERVAEQMGQVIEQSEGPAEALRACVHHQLALAYDPRRARQTSVLTSAEARAAVGFDQVNEDAAAVRRHMLAEVIREGRTRGVFPSSDDPVEDARAVMSVVLGLIQARLTGHEVPSWEGATAHTTGLFLRAFGVDRHGSVR